MVEGWQRIRDPFLDALFTPFPPVRAGARLARRLGVAGGLDFTRLALLSVRRFAEEEFSSEEARILLSGNAMHSDVSPDGAGSALFGWLLVMMGQDVGFPVPEGGAGALAQALRRRAESRGVQVRCGVAVTSVEVSGGRARGVRLADGTTLRARHGVLADVPAPALYGGLVGREHLPARLVRDVERFDWDDATLKLNWALDAPIPWVAPAARRAGTVHLGVDHDGLVDVAADLSVGRMPRDPFILLGQMTTADPTRSPAGTESAWAYTHLPRRLAHDDAAVARQVERMEEAVEQVAPGFLGTVRGRFVQTPRDLEAADGEPPPRGAQRRDGGPAPAARAPPDPRARSPGDARPRALPRRGLGPPGRRGPRGLRLERRPRGDPAAPAARAGAAGVRPHRVGPRPQGAVSSWR